MAPKKPARAPLPRARRSPEEARALILAAAVRLFEQRGPDAVGLKDVAREAGVSHALVTHYFGTYEGLVETVMEAQTEAMRAELLARVATARDEGPAAWIETAFQTVSPAQGRLLAWAIMTGRTQRSDFFARRVKGMAIVADALEHWARAQGLEVDRDEVEVSLLLSTATLMGYAVGRSVLWAALGREVTPERDRAVRERFASMLAESSLQRAKPAVEVRPKPRKKSST